MSEKETIKVSLSTVILLCIIFVLVVAIILMYFYYNNNTPNTTTSTSSSTSSEAPSKVDATTEAKKVKKLDETKEIVYDSYTKTGVGYSYTLPYINIDSKEAKRINTQIEEYYKPIINENLQDEEESVFTHIIEYKSYINDNVLSLLITLNTVHDTTEYKVYNLDIYTGKEITNSELIDIKNISEKELLDTMETVYSDFFADLYKTVKDEQPEEYERNLARTISSDNYSLQTPMFLNENGKLCVIAHIYTYVGPESIYTIINTKI